MDADQTSSRQVRREDHHPIEELRTTYRHRDSPLTPDLGVGTGAPVSKCLHQARGQAAPGGPYWVPDSPAPSNSLTCRPSIHVLEAIMGIALPAASLGSAVPQVGIYTGLHQPCGFSHAGLVQPGTLLCSHPSCCFTNRVTLINAFQNRACPALRNFFKVTAFLPNY